MGKKFTDEDLFRISRNNLSDPDKISFIFSCETAAFRGAISDVFSRDLGVTKDERNLLEKIFSRIRTGGILRGGR